MFSHSAMFKEGKGIPLERTPTPFPQQKLGFFDRLFRRASVPSTSHERNLRPSVQSPQAASSSVAANDEMIPPPVRAPKMIKFTRTLSLPSSLPQLMRSPTPYPENSQNGKFSWASIRDSLGMGASQSDSNSPRSGSKKMNKIRLIRSPTPYPGSSESKGFDIRNIFRKSSKKAPRKGSHSGSPERPQIVILRKEPLDKRTPPENVRSEGGLPAETQAPRKSSISFPDLQKGSDIEATPPQQRITIMEPNLIGISRKNKQKSLQSSSNIAPDSGIDLTGSSTQST
jgi:hypothetical protein